MTVRYGHAPPVVGVLAPSLLALYPALLRRRSAPRSAALGARGVAGPLAVAALWTALYDHARSFVLTGFPWAMLGYAQHQNAVLLPLVTWTGATGSRFVERARRRGAGRARRGTPRGSRRRRGVVPPHALGLALAPRAAGRTEPPGRGAAGQHRPGRQVERRLARAHPRDLRAPPRGGARRARELIVWPETAVPGALEADGATLARVRALARETRAWLVVGGVGLEWDAGRAPDRLLRQRLRRGRRGRAPRPLRQDAPRALRRVRAAARPARPLRAQRGARHRARRTSRRVHAPRSVRVAPRRRRRRAGRRRGLLRAALPRSGAPLPAPTAASCWSASPTTPGTAAPARRTSSSRSPRCARPRPACGPRAPPTPACRPSSTPRAACASRRRSSSRGCWWRTCRATRVRAARPSTCATATSSPGPAGSGRRSRLGATAGVGGVAPVRRERDE